MFVQDVTDDSSLSPLVVADKGRKVQLLSALVSEYQHVAGLVRAFRSDALMALGAGKVRVVSQGAYENPWKGEELI